MCKIDTSVSNYEPIGINRRRDFIDQGIKRFTRAILRGALQPTVADVDRRTKVCVLPVFMTKSRQTVLIEIGQCGLTSRRQGVVRQSLHDVTKSVHCQSGVLHALLASRTQS